jgi:hypothetical protein
MDYGSTNASADSTADWEREAARMSAVYSNAVATISAAKSTSSQSGCFANRDGNLTRPIESETGGWLCCTIVQTSSTNQLRTPLYKRSWVLQEEILSRRMIVYGVSGLRWICVTAEASESEPEMKHHSTQRFGSWADISDQKNVLRYIMHRPTDIEIRSKFDAENWHEIIEDYTSRGLTYSVDKLAALAGVADAFQKSTNDAYYAGNWKEWLLNGLIWLYVGRDLGSSRHPEPIAPSWSWASVTGRVRFTVIRPRYSSKFLAELVDVETHGTISRQTGKLTLRGHVWKTRLLNVEEWRNSGYYPHYHVVLEDGGRLYPDESLEMGTEIWQIALVQDSRVSSIKDGSLSYDNVYSLALLRNDQRNGEEYRRVGIVTPSPQTSDKARGAKGLQERTIVIV